MKGDDRLTVCRKTVDACRKRTKASRKRADAWT
jgi:hypothetical protein